MSNVKCQMSNGQSLIEVVIALGVLIALAVSLVATSLITQKSARNAKNNTQATKLVQQSIEQLRIFRDRQGFSALVNSDCWDMINTSDVDVANWKLANSTSSPSSTCPGVITLDKTDFSRKIIIENPPSPLDPLKAKKITVTVEWTDSGGTQKVSNVTNLSNCVTASVTC